MIHSAMKTPALDIVKSFREPDIQQSLCICQWELGNLTQAVIRSQWSPSLAVGYQGEGKLGMADLLTQLQVICELQGWDFESLRGLGLDHLEERADEIIQRRGSRFEGKLGGGMR